MTAGTAGAPPNGAGGGAGGPLATPVRNAYFHGKLLDADHLQLEQDYLNGQRRLLNRLVLGTGVVTGLAVLAGSDGTSVAVAPGVALDPYGREIVVPAAAGPIDPRQPTGADGAPSGDRIEDAATVTINLVHRACLAEPAPVLTPEAAGHSFAASVVQETFAVVVTAVEAPAPDSGQSPPPGSGTTPATPTSAGTTLSEALGAAVAARAGAPYRDVAGAGLVPLAAVHLPAGGTPVTSDMIDMSVRATVPSPAVLADAVTGQVAELDEHVAAQAADLTSRVNAQIADLTNLARPLLTRPVLEYVGGDAQQGTPGVKVPEPLTVRVTDGAGAPLAGVTVTFAVRGGGGLVAIGETSLGPSVAMVSSETGLVPADWELGPEPGIGSVGATVPGGSSVTFVALSTRARAPARAAARGRSTSKGKQS